MFSNTPKLLFDVTKAIYPAVLRAVLFLVSLATAQATTITLSWSPAKANSYVYMVSQLRRRLQRLVVAVALGMLPAFAFAGPTLFFSDLDSGPNTGGEGGGGVHVTVYGKRLGTTGTVTVGGGATTVKRWSDTKVTVQLGAASASGNIVLTNADGTSNSLPFTVRPGRIFFISPNGTGTGTVASPASPKIIHTSMQPGDTYYFRAGTYTANYGDTTWQDNNFTLGAGQRGTAGSPLALVGYPGELVTLNSPGRTNIGFNTNAGSGGYTTVANMTLVGDMACVDDGGWWAAANSGAVGVRIVGNVCSAQYTGNTMTGVLTIRNNNWRVWGNEFKDTGTTPPINNNHALYVQSGASDVDIGWNTFRNLRMGHVIQIHTDSAVINGGPSCYTFSNIQIHDNVLTATNIDDSRGINFGNACSGSNGAIYNNVLYNLGQNFSAIAIYNGSWKIYNNTLYKINATSGMVWIQGSSTATADVRNNAFYSDGSSPYVTAFSGASMSQITLASNLYYNRGNGPSQDTTAINADPKFVDAAAGNFRLTSPGSPAIDKGNSSVSTIVKMDQDGNARPLGNAFDIGAFEAGGAAPSPAPLENPQNLRIIDGQ